MKSSSCHQVAEPSDPDLSVQQQCILLDLARSSFYNMPVGENDKFFIRLCKKLGLFFVFLQHDEEY